jgi:hypothetical protein
MYSFNLEIEWNIGKEGKEEQKRIEDGKGILGRDEKKEEGEDNINKYM